MSSTLLSMAPFTRINFSQCAVYGTPSVRMWKLSDEYITIYCLDGAARLIQVIAGERVELPCPQQPKFANDEPILVLWYRTSNTTPIYSYDARSGTFDKGMRWADMNVLGMRSYFTLSKDPPVLTIDPSVPEDEGSYTCRFDYNQSPTSYHKVILKVIVLPGSPHIIMGGREVIGIVGPLNLDSRLKMICRSWGGHPSPSLTWWHEGRMLESQMSVVDKGRELGVEARLTNIVTRSLHNTILKCHASNTNLTTPLVASVTIRVLLEPLFVRILGESSPVSAGSTAQFVCQSAGSNPPASLTWWRGNEQLTDTQHSVLNNGNTTNAVLTLTPGMDDDGQEITCKAENTDIAHTPSWDRRTLDVYYVPAVKVVLAEPKDKFFVTEGDHVTLQCLVRANPSVHRIDWFHNGKLLSSNVSAGVLLRGPSLSLVSIERFRSGHYVCAAENLEGRGTSDSWNLTIRYAPVCTRRRFRTQGIAMGAQALVRCHVEALPKEVSFAWSLNVSGHMTDISDHSIKNEGLISTVLYTPSTPTSYGTLLCWATNAVGQQREPCEIRIVPAGPPDAPSNCSILNQTGRALRVECVEGFDGGLPQHFILEAWLENKLLANISSEFPDLEVLDWKSGALLKVRAVNAMGISKPVILQAPGESKPLYVTVRDESFRKDVHALNSPVLQGLLVGSIALFVILLLVTSVVAARRSACHSEPKSPSPMSTETEDQPGGVAAHPVENNETAEAEGATLTSTSPDVVVLVKNKSTWSGSLKQIPKSVDGNEVPSASSPRFSLPDLTALRQEGSVMYVAVPTSDLETKEKLMNLQGSAVLESSSTLRCSSGKSLSSMEEEVQCYVSFIDNSEHFASAKENIPMKDFQMARDFPVSKQSVPYDEGDDSINIPKNLVQKTEMDDVRILRIVRTTTSEVPNNVKSLAANGADSISHSLPSSPTSPDDKVTFEKRLHQLTKDIEDFCCSQDPMESPDTIESYYRKPGVHRDKGEPKNLNALGEPNRRVLGQTSKAQPMSTKKLRALRGRSFKGPDPGPTNLPTITESSSNPSIHDHTGSAEFLKQVTDVMAPGGHDDVMESKNKNRILMLNSPDDIIHIASNIEMSRATNV
ncbi:neural cell adhesion molecule 1-like [Oratosquilla oratoria]|uniref:neural cell adhesion molecule 1-like n=1 Tax=Oratosquilla oratoria TaxID=337810 RepID=UPI003F775463